MKVGVSSIAGSSWADLQHSLLPARRPLFPSAPAERDETAVIIALRVHIRRRTSLNARNNAHTTRFLSSSLQGSSSSRRRGTTPTTSSSASASASTPRGLLQLLLAAAAALAASNVPRLASAEPSSSWVPPSLGDALRAGPLAALAGGGSSSSPSSSASPKLYNVQPDGTCGLPGQFLSITVTGTSGSLANTACSLEAQGFPDPQPEEDCDGLLFGKECSQLAAGLVLTVGGFGKGTDGPDVSALLRLLGLSRLESVGGLFFDVGDGAKVKHVDALPRLARVGPGGLQLLGSRQIQSAPGMKNVRTVEGPTYLVATALPELGSLLPAATELGGGVVVVNNPSLVSFAGASPNLTAIGGSLVVAANHRLRSFEGLEALSSVGVGGGASGGPSAPAAAAAPLSGAASATAGVSITNNTRLTSLRGLSGLTTVGGGLQVSNNPTLVSLAGLEAVASVGGGASAGAAGGGAGGASGSAVAVTPANAGVLVTGNRVLSDVSALAGVGRCSARKAARAKAAGSATAAPGVDGTPPVQVEVYVVSGVAPSPAAAKASSAPSESGGGSTAADLPPQINDAASPRQAELAAAAARAARAASVGKGAPSPAAVAAAAAASEPPLRVQAVESEEEVAIREAAAEEGEEEGSSRNSASEASSSDDDSSSDGKSVVSKRKSAQDKGAATLAAALQAAGYNGVDEAAVAAALEAGATEEELVAAVAGAVAQRAKEGSRPSPASSPSPAPAAAAAERSRASSSRRALAQFGANPLEQLLGASPLGPLLPQPGADANARLASEGDKRGGGLLPLPPLPWNTNGKASAAPSSTTVADAQLAAAVAIRPDTRCMLTSWDDVCSFIDGGGAVPADSPWRASGVCVPYSQPAPPPPASSTGNAGGLRISGK